MIQADVLDENGNLHTADIGITWADNEIFLHGVRVVGAKILRPTGQEPVMSTPYPVSRPRQKRLNSARKPSPTTSSGPRPVIQADVLDENGNLHAADIGITWADNEIFLHGVRVVGAKILRPTGQEPVMSTPYPVSRPRQKRLNSARKPTPTTVRPAIIPIARRQKSGRTNPAIQQQVA